MFIDKLHYLNYKDFKLRKSFLRYELQLYLIKSFVFDVRLKFSTRFILKNKKYTNKYFLTKIRSHCVLVGKPRFIFKYFRLNRSTLKQYSSFGFISGFQKF